MTQEVAADAGVGVARVLDPTQDVVARTSLEFGARQVEKRAQQYRSPLTQGTHARNGGEPIDAAAAQGIEQHGLGLVVAVLREQDGVGVDFGKRRHTCVARGCLRALTTGTLDDHPPCEETRTHVRCDALAMRHPVIGCGLQAVVDVNCDRWARADVARDPADRVQQDRGIKPAAETDRQSGVAVRKPRRGERGKNRRLRPVAAQSAVSLKRP